MPARMKPREALRHYEKLVAAAVELCASPGMLFVASCTYSTGRFGVFGVLGWGDSKISWFRKLMKDFLVFYFYFYLYFFFCCCCSSDYLLLLLLFWLFVVVVVLIICCCCCCDYLLLWLFVVVVIICCCCCSSSSSCCDYLLWCDYLLFLTRIWTIFICHLIALCRCFKFKNPTPALMCQRHDAFPGERELMGICSRALSWAQREYRLVSTGSQAGDGVGGDEGSRWKRPWAEIACVSESSFSPGFLVWNLRHPQWCEHNN